MKDSDPDEAFEDIDAPESLHPTMFAVVHRRGPHHQASWSRPVTLTQLWHLLSMQPTRDNVRLVVGNTACGIQPFQPFLKKQTIMICIANIPELTKMSYDRSTIAVGAAVAIYRLLNLCKSFIQSKRKASARSTYPPEVIYNHLQQLATIELRNVGSLAGNLYLAKMWGFPSDLCLVLTTLNATVVVRGASPSSAKTYNMMDFLTTNASLEETKIIFEINIPIEAQENVFIRTYKVAKRLQNSHALVNAGFSMKVGDESFKDVCITFGNIGNKNICLPETEKWVEHMCNPKKLSTQLPALLEQIECELKRNVKPHMHNLPDMEEAHNEQFRVNTARNLFFKYLVEMAKVFNLPGWNDMSSVSAMLMVITAFSIHRLLFLYEYAGLHVLHSFCISAYHVRELTKHSISWVQFIL